MRLLLGHKIKIDLLQGYFIKVPGLIISFISLIYGRNVEDLRVVFLPSEVEIDLAGLACSNECCLIMSETISILCLFKFSIEAVADHLRGD